ncbi:MAG TPA: hypothetical protein VMX17_09130 [Candidatus Glassbacteria bacterium]|nr:hypothetical protein [Candidatus Glassbacteria bacterium]
MLDKTECLKWCKDNKKELSKHTNMFVAVCLKKGIIVSEANERFFIKIFCKAISKKDRSGVFITHTSAFDDSANISPKEAHAIRRANTDPSEAGKRLTQRKTPVKKEKLNDDSGRDISQT